MVSETSDIAYEILVMSYLHPEDTMSDIAAKLGYSPLYIINAMECGIERKWYNFDADNDKLINKVAMEDVRRNANRNRLGEGADRLEEEILDMLERVNQKEEDISEDKLRAWVYNINPAIVDMVLFFLEDQRIIERYTLTDPEDEDSKYVFITLEQNAGEKWGKKQFKVQPSE